MKSLDGNTLTLVSGDTETVVTLSENTQIVKTTTGASTDLTAGLQVMVTGERDADGNVTATQVTILGAGIDLTPVNTTP